MRANNIVITGGFGYIGGRLTQKLAHDGMSVRISTRRSADQIPAWAEDHPNISWGHALDELCQDADVLVHLAAPNEIIAAAHPQQSIAETVSLTKEALDAALRAGISKFIFFSTIHVYGAPLSGHLTEATPTRPVHPYAVGHRDAEDLVNAAHSANMQTLVLRLSNGFGAPADRYVDRWSLLIPDLCRQTCVENRVELSSPGHQLRDFIPLSDITNATAYFVTAGNTAWQHRVINLSSGISISVREMAERVLIRARDLISPDITFHVPQGPLPEPSCQKLRIDNTRLYEAGFHPALLIDTELDDLLMYCRSNFMQQP